jgi:hypothetical protein
MQRLAPLLRLQTACLALMLSLGYLTSPGVALAQETITLGGLLRNDTADADFAPEQALVTLRILDGVVQVENRAVTPGPDGLFSFSEVPVAQGRTYFLTVEHQGAIYSAALRAEQLADPVTLTVYEATSSADSLVMINHTLIVTGVDVELRVVEILERANIANRGDRTLVAVLAGDMGGFLRFALPEGYHHLDVRSNLVGGDVLEVNLGFAVTTPVPPSGESPHLFEYVYRVPYTGSTLELSRPLRFGAESFRLVVPTDVAVASSPQLTDLGTADISDRELQLLEGTALPVGMRLDLNLTGLPEPSPLSRLGRSASRWYLAAGAPALLALAFVGVLGFSILRRPRIKPSTVATGPDSELQ